MNTITGITGDYSQQTSSSSPDRMKELDKDAFLLLLVTQLRHQDPLDPQDNSEFLAQMAQFTSLEQLQNLNGNMEKLVQFQNDSLEVLESLAEKMENLFQGQDMFQLSLLGRVVTVREAGGGIVTGMVSALEFVEGVPKLMVNGQAYSLEQLVKVEMAGTAEENEEVEDSDAVVEDTGAAEDTDAGENVNGTGDADTAEESGEGEDSSADESGVIDE